MSRAKEGSRATLHFCCLAVCGVSMVLCLRLVIYGAYEVLYNKNFEYPSPEGLLCGLAGAGLGQVGCVIYQYIRRQMFYDKSVESRIQLRDTPYTRTFVQDVIAHVQRAELFLLVPYLSLTWMFRLMPESYYDIEAPVNWLHVVMQLLVVDFFTYVFHAGEHAIPSWYILGHKAHHKFTNPQMYNAFDATIPDAVFLILFPLFSTAQLCHVNCWSYIAFGATYSTHFMLIHSEFEHGFDKFLSMFSVYTSADHHVHHKLFVYNYGHFFTIYDRIGGTYKDPSTVKGFRVFKEGSEYVK